jgi:hypothetical protein
MRAAFNTYDFDGCFCCANPGNSHQAHNAANTIALRIIAVSSDDCPKNRLLKITGQPEMSRRSGFFGAQRATRIAIGLRKLRNVHQSLGQNRASRRHWRFETYQLKHIPATVTVASGYGKNRPVFSDLRECRWWFLFAANAKNYRLLCENFVRIMPGAEKRDIAACRELTPPLTAFPDRRQLSISVRFVNYSGASYGHKNQSPAFVPWLSVGGRSA